MSRREPRSETVLNIDHTLVTALEQVEQAAGVYLTELSEVDLGILRQALVALDDVTEASDRWTQSIASSAAWGYGDTRLAIGQTGTTPVIDSEGSSLFEAQVTMVHAAKAVVLHPGPGAVETLRRSLAAVGERAR